MRKNRMQVSFPYRFGRYLVLIVLWSCKGPSQSDIIYENVCSNGNIEILKSSKVLTGRSNNRMEKLKYIIKNGNQTIEIDSNYIQLSTTLFMKGDTFFESNCHRNNDHYFVTFSEFCCLNLLVFEIKGESLIIKKKYKFTSSFTWINLDEDRIFYLEEMLPDSSNSTTDLNQIIYRQGLLNTFERDSVIIESEPKLSDLDILNPSKKEYVQDIVFHFDSLVGINKGK